MQELEQNIVIHTTEDLEAMRKAGSLAAQTLDYITPFIKPGITTGELDKLCHDFIINNGAIPAPLNYKGFPKSICTSVNHVICHGIPGTKVLKQSDIINVDITVILDGWHGDSSRMYIVGDKTSIKANRLIKVTYDAMMLGIEQVKPGRKLYEVGKAIQSYAEKHNFSVVRDFCGHGIGKSFHAAPNVLHYYAPELNNTTLKEGMFFTIEPMINGGQHQVRILNDGWTAVTKDKSLSAQFEHTIAVTKDGAEILTQSPKGYLMPPYF